MKFRGWSKTPTSKPLAALAALLTVIVVLISVCAAREIPSSVVELLMWFDALTIGGYLGKSVVENNWGTRQKNTSSSNGERNDGQDS